MKKYLVGFVILHYLDIHMTEKCIKYIIKNFSQYHIQIVIVDNYSNNGSGELLRKKYSLLKNIKVFVNKENLGFAKGNNVGYCYLRNFYNVDFIVIINNDILIEQKNFIEKVINIYERSHFSILGPDIYCPITKVHQNPTREKGLSIKEVNNLYEILVERKLHYNKFYFKKILTTLLPVNWVNNQIKSLLFLEERKNPVLHGACYIFSKEFIDKRSLAFNPQTFLYLEEEILYLECMANNMLMLYSPELKVLHLEDISTKHAYKSEYKRIKMKINYQLDSIKILIKVMKDIARYETDENKT